VTGAFLALVEHRPAVAVLLGALASATRPEGVAVGIAILAWYLLQGDRRWGRIALSVGASELGFLAWTAYLWHHFGRPFEELSAQKYWNRHATWPLRPFEASLQLIFSGRFTGPGSGNAVAVLLIDDAAILFATLAVVLLVLWSRRISELRWMWIATLAPLLLLVSNGPFGNSPEGAARIVMCMPALYLVLARVRNDLVWTLVVVVSVVLAVGCQLIFNLGGWFT
jgi:hypothetical protein